MLTRTTPPPPCALSSRVRKQQPDTLPQEQRDRLWALGKPEQRYLGVSLVATAFSGAMFPVFSLMLSTIITFFYLRDPDELERKVCVCAC